MRLGTQLSGCSGQPEAWLCHKPPPQRGTAQTSWALWAAAAPAGAGAWRGVQARHEAERHAGLSTGPPPGGLRCQECPTNDPGRSADEGP